MHFRHSYVLVLAELVFLYFGTQDVVWAQQDQQAQWTPVLLQPVAKIRAPTEPLRIRLANIPTNTLPQLALELDEIDVTALVTMEGDVAVFTPPQPLAYGEHQLRLVQNSPDGSINELGEWSFELRKNALFRDAQLNGNVTVKGSYRTLDKELGDPAPDRGMSEGMGQFYGSAENENWRLNGMLSIIANSQSQLMPRQRGHLDMGQFLIAADSGLYGLKVGDQQLGPDNLVLHSFARRGISASATTPGGTAAVTAFSMHTTPITGAVNVLGVADSTDRVDGTVAMIKPIPGNAEALALMGTYANGKSGDSQGSSVIGGPGASSGSAGSIIADSNLFLQRLRLRGEIAKSTYDFDGSAGQLAPLNGHAYSGLANYIPWHDMTVYDQPLLWNMGLEKKLISTYFRSVANPGGISDRDMSRLFTGVNWYGLDVQLNAGKESDNVDDNPLIPITDSKLRSATVTYNPPMNYALQANGQPPEPPWYGQPNFNASFSSLNRDIVQINGAATSQPIHSTYSSAAGANFQYATWNWNITQTWVNDQGYNLDPTPHTRSSNTQLQGNFRLFTKLSVGMSASSNNINTINAGIKSNVINEGLNLAYPFTDTVSSTLNYSTNHNWSTDGTSDTISSNTLAGVSWILNASHGIEPGVTLGLDGSYQDIKNKSAFSAQPGTVMYQVFLRLTLAWAPVY